MKSLILTIALLLSAMLHSQTIPLKNISESAARSFADQITSQSKTKWEFISAKKAKSGDYFIVRYANATQSKDVIEGVKNGDSCDDCLVVTFSVNRSDNTLKFYEVWGKYEDLFPTWKKFFRPDADQLKTANDFGTQELIDKPAGINYKFKKEETSWHITNWS